MRQSRSMRVWGVVYPIGVYFVITAVALLILDFVLPETADSKLLRQLITSAAALPFLYSFYRKDRMLSADAKKMPCGRLPARRLQSLPGAFLTGGCFALAFNNLLSLSEIEDYSVSYGQVEETFYTGRIVLELVALCVVIPLAEELLYRGIVYGRIRDWLGKSAAVVGSALIFGLIHMNLVQFVYASVFGLLLAYYAETMGNPWGAAAAHMAANLTSVLRTETEMFAWMQQSRAIYFGTTAALLVAAGAGLLFQRKISDVKEAVK